MSKGTIQYFGYGANRDIRMMRAITGAQDLKGVPATLEGYALCVQRYDQIPNAVSDTSPAPISPRAIVRANWPETFTSYTVKPDPESKVAGTVWELTPLQRELVRDWEIIDLGWYQDATVEVLTQDGGAVQVQTEILGDGQEVDRKVDGTNYETWLNDPEDFDRIAEKSRREFFERAAQNSEGTPKIKENK